MKIGYYPGCTLKTKARNLEEAAIRAMEVLGVELVELDRWNCCGAVYSLADDDLVHLLAPARDLIRAHDQGFDTLLTLCSMCYNTLARTNRLMREDAVKREALNEFMEEENDYRGEVEVVHFLNFIRDRIGWDKVKEAVKVPLEGLNVAPYYGCTLTRPREISIDHAIHHHVFEDMIEAVGANAVTFDEAETCCGSYQVVSNPDAAGKTLAGILRSAENHQVDMLVLSCPLCEYNLGRRQGLAIEADDSLSSMPVIYMSQLMALALGVPSEELKLDLNIPAVEQLLASRGYLPVG